MTGVVLRNSEAPRREPQRPFPTAIIVSYLCVRCQCVPDYLTEISPVIGFAVNTKFEATPPKKNNVATVTSLSAITSQFSHSIALYFTTRIVCLSILHLCEHSCNSIACVSSGPVCRLYTKVSLSFMSLFFGLALDCSCQLLPPRNLPSNMLE